MDDKVALNALHLAYVTLLQMPYGKFRARHQTVLARVRDAIAELTGKDAETVQAEYESLVGDMSAPTSPS